MKYKNAGIKDFITAEKKLREGETFHLRGSIIYYDFNYIKEGESPYRIRPRDSASSPLQETWESAPEWECLVSWEKTLSEHPRLCWVWDTDVGDISIDLVIDYVPNSSWKYITSTGEHRDALPLTKEEIRIYLENADD